MRDLPHTTRVAIATLYVRYREDRRRHAAAQARAVAETGDPVTPHVLRLSAEMTTTWNALQAVLRNVFDDTGSPRTEAHEFLRMIAIKGRQDARLAAPTPKAA